jgi:hypothetical protein
LLSLILVSIICTGFSQLIIPRLNAAPNQTSTITGKIYNDTNQNGFQDGFESDYNSTTKILPIGTTVTITQTDDTTNTFTLTPNIDGTYSQTVLVAAIYSVSVNTPSNYSVSQSIELGNIGNTGSNPTLVQSSGFGVIISAGKDGIYLAHEITGSIYPDININGIQDATENYSTTNPIPTGTQVKIECTYPALTTFTYFPAIGANGYYLQQVEDLNITGTTCKTTIIPPVGLSVSNSTELGDNGVGTNPTIVQMPAGAISRSQGKDGLYQISTTGIITGSVYIDINDNGIQESYEILNLDNYTLSNALIVLQNIDIPDLVYTPTLNLDGTYSQNVYPGNYYVNNVFGQFINHYSNSQENGQGTGSNPTLITVGANEIKFAGKDGLVNYSSSLCTRSSELRVNLNILGSIKASAEELPTNCATVSGSLYEDKNNNGIQNSNEPNYSSINAIPAGVSAVLKLVNDITVFFELLINPDGSYSKEVPSGQYQVEIISPAGYTLSNSIENGAGTGSNPTVVNLRRGVTTQAGKDGLFNGVLPVVQPAIAGVSTINITKDKTKPEVKQESQVKTDIQNITSSLPTLAIDRKFDLNDPYVCGSYVYGNVISSPSIIADIKIEFTQDGKIVKPYTLKTNSDGTWKQLLEDLPYGKYSYKVVSSYQELIDTESFAIEHRSLEECNYKSEIQDETTLITTVRTGGQHDNTVLGIVLIIMGLALGLSMTGKKKIEE